MVKYIYLQKYMVGLSSDPVVKWTSRGCGRWSPSDATAVVDVVIFVNCLLCFLEAAVLALGGRRGTVTAPQLLPVTAEKLV